MTLDEYRATDDSNAFWRMDSGAHLNLLEEAIERIDKAEHLVEDLNNLRDKAKSLEGFVHMICQDIDDLICEFEGGE